MHPIIVTLGVALLTGAVGLVVGRATAARTGRTGTGSPAGPTGDAGVTRFVASLTEFGETVAPIWTAQIDTSRQQIDTAVATLTERFAEIVAVLERVVGASTDGSPYGDESLFDASRTQLDGVIGTLNQAVEHKQHTLDGLRGLLEYNDRLRTMTADVGRIAAQTRLLALNASIEAARVGEAGRGFGVVATEVGELAGASARTGRQIEQLVDEVSAAIDGTLATAEQNASIEDTMVSDANTTVQSVLDDLQGFVGGLQEVSLMVGEMAAQIRSDVSGALVHLQFQDRVDQKLGHVSAGIEAFPRALAAAVAEGAGALVPLDTAALLEEMTSTYTMVEELAVHGGSTAASDAPDHDITFF